MSAKHKDIFIQSRLPLEQQKFTVDNIFTLDQFTYKQKSHEKLLLWSKSA